jgi:phosphopantetheine adenylyltransferase
MAEVYLWHLPAVEDDAEDLARRLKRVIRDFYGEAAEEYPVDRVVVKRRTGRDGAEEIDLDAEEDGVYIVITDDDLNPLAAFRIRE